MKETGAPPAVATIASTSSSGLRLTPVAVGRRPGRQWARGLRGGELSGGARRSTREACLPQRWHE